jgi:hypothetical protein
MEEFQKHWPTLLTVAGVALLCFLSLRIGAAFAYLGFTSADTCWLLSLGQIIDQTRAIPSRDLFSFTLPLCAELGQPQPYIVYQWLSELVFFYIERGFQPIGLLIAGGMVTALAFLCIPLRACIRANAPPIWSFLALIGASTTSNIRSMIRPELFSCLILALYMAVLQPLRYRQVSDGAKGTIDWKSIALTTLFMIVWCNMHPGFISGIIIVAIYALSSLLEDLAKKRTLSSATKTLLLCFFFSSLATLVNPYGLGLWLYLPHLFFAPINARFTECKHLLASPLSVAGYFLFLSLVCCTAVALTIRNCSMKTPEILRSPKFVSSVLIVIIAVCFGLAVMRLTPLVAIIMVVETASFIGNRAEESLWPKLVWHNRLSYLFLSLTTLVFVALGTLDLVRKGVTVTIPVTSRGFVPSFPSVQYFMHAYKKGRVICFLSIADMLDLYWGPHSALFADSRMDAYSEKITHDYVTILSGKNGWRELLDSYHIDWVFLYPSNPLCHLLELEPGWNAIYQDSAAKIFQRSQQE